MMILISAFVTTCAFVLKCMVTAVLTILFVCGILASMDGTYLSRLADRHEKEKKKTAGDKPKEIRVRITMWNAQEDTSGKA